MYNKIIIAWLVHTGYTQSQYPKVLCSTLIDAVNDKCANTRCRIRIMWSRSLVQRDYTDTETVQSPSWCSLTSLISICKCQGLCKRVEGPCKRFSTYNLVQGCLWLEHARDSFINYNWTTFYNLVTTLWQPWNFHMGVKIK